MIQERNNFKMGTVEMLLLSLLSQKDLYGYEISLLLKDLSSGAFVVPEGSLYPTLYKLEDKNTSLPMRLRPEKEEFGRWVPCSERLPKKPIIGEDGYLVQLSCVAQPFSAYWDGFKWTDEEEKC